MKNKVTLNLTGKLLRISVANSSTGLGLTGLTHSSAGLTWAYFRDGDTGTSLITAAAATLGTWTSGGFVEVDPTNMPGVYELGVPNACFAKAGTLNMYIKGATNMSPCAIEIEVDQVNYQDADTFGLAAITRINRSSFLALLASLNVATQANAQAIDDLLG